MIIHKQLILVLFTLFALHGSSQEADSIIEQPIEVLPNEHLSAPSIGYAGMFGGLVDDRIIAAGGANFPEGMPWEGGPKKWSDQIYMLKDQQWSISETKLPSNLAYGASVKLDEGILCIGGANANQISDRVFLIHYNASEDRLELKNYPSLPQALAFTTATKVDDYVYVVGGNNKEGSTNVVYRMNLKGSNSWEQLDDFPGPARALHAIAVQQTATHPKLVVIGGRSEVKGKKSTALSSYLSLDLKDLKWSQPSDISIDGTKRVLMGAAAQAEGSMHILVYGGSDEVLFDELETIALNLKEESNDSIAKALVKRRDEILTTHPGFSKDIIAFNTITEQWFVHQTLDKPLPVTALSFEDDEALIMISGELSPGIRTAENRRFITDESKQRFGVINYTVLALYLIISVLIGIYFSRKQKSTNDYFTGGGRIPWWASGLSVFGTLLSAITFMAIPAKAFITDWSFFFLNITAILITPLIAFVFIPFYNRLKIKTAYEYLESRFNYTARAFGSLSFILFQLGRIGIVLLLPSLAISIVTGIPVELSILIMGVLCIVYTTFGGIEAVIWTDVMQVIVLMGGSVLAVVWILTHTESSVGEMFAYASERNKFNILDMNFNFTESTFWVVFIGGLASAMVTQGTDQTIVQRFLTSTDVKKSQKTLYTNAILTLPATLIFFGIGTLLYIFYSEFPMRLAPSISNNDSIFPWYIVNELPIGVSGLLIAGIFSAAMSSISSSLNSVSTAYCNDFHLRFNTSISDHKLLKIARIATIVTGLIGLALALLMANASIQSLWDQFYRFLGLFTGGLGGMFLLGMLTKKANAKGTLIGLAISAVLIWYVSVYTDINFLMYSFLGVASCFGFGYLFSLIFKQKIND